MILLFAGPQAAAQAQQSVVEAATAANPGAAVAQLSFEALRGGVPKADVAGIVVEFIAPHIRRRRVADEEWLFI